MGILSKVKEFFYIAKEKIKNAFKNLHIEKNKDIAYIEIPQAERVTTIREAIFSESEEINVQNALGKVCASPTVSCPPAIPIAVSGEKIIQKHIDLFTRYGIDIIQVIKD